MKVGTETIAVTGATGFIGRHVLDCLKRLRNHRIIAVGRDCEKLESLNCEFVQYDLKEQAPDCYERLERPDRLIHLAWDGLPDYDGPIHLEQNLVLSQSFIKQLVESGLRRISVTGTCLEYGLQSGSLTEEHPTTPCTCYGVAKDTLRKSLDAMMSQHNFQYNWLRLFYMHGKGQKRNTLFAQLEDAISSNAESFDMSGGEQVRDYLPVEKVAEGIVKVSLQNVHNGIFNISSNNPVSVHELVLNRLEASGARMSLNFGRIPYAAYEPMSFWGDNTKMIKALASYDKNCEKYQKAE